MIFQDDHKDAFFDVGKDTQFQSGNPADFLQSQPKAPGSRNTERKNRKIDRVNLYDSGGNGVFETDAVAEDKRHADSPNQKRTDTRADERNGHSANVVEPITAVCFPQPAHELANVRSMDKEGKADPQSRVQTKDQSVGSEIRGANIAMPNKERPAMESMPKSRSINQSIFPKKDGVENRVPPTPPSGGNNSNFPSDIFEQIKERFNDFHGALNESKTPQPVFKSEGIAAASEAASSSSNVQFDDFSEKEKDSESSPAPSVPRIDTPDFKASAGETVTATGYRIISLAGHVEQEHKNVLERFLNKVLYQGNSNLLFDMTKLKSMSSSGWSVLVSYMQRLRKQDCSIVLCAMSTEVLQGFRVLELDKLFSSYHSVFEALRGIKQEVETDQTGRQKHLAIQRGSALEKPESTADLPLDEKIRRIVVENPDLNVGKINKKLKSEEYGNVSLSIWALQAKLRALGLGTKEERHRFFRSS